MLDESLKTKVEQINTESPFINQPINSSHYNIQKKITYTNLANSGRIKIYTSIDENDIDESNLYKVVNDAKVQHDINVSDYKTLLKFYNGDHAIKNRTKVIRPEIDNQVSENLQQHIIMTTTSYFLRHPIIYTEKDHTISSTSKDNDTNIQTGSFKDETLEDINKLNNYLQFENKNAVDKNIAFDCSLYGVGYRYINMTPDPDRYLDIAHLDPTTTFVIYSNNILKKPIIAVTYYQVTAPNGDTFLRYYIYTRKYVYVCDSDKTFRLLPFNTNFATNNNIKFYALTNLNGLLPIIEYENNRFRMGDFEPVINDIELLGVLKSDRVNGVEQFIQSLLVFINCAVSDNIVQQLQSAGVIEVKQSGGQTPIVKFLTEELNQSHVQMLIDDIRSTIDTICHIPSHRKASGGNTKDTGDAVSLRDGWEDLEILACVKEGFFSKGEYETLNVILAIFKIKNITKDNFLQGIFGYNSILNLTPININVKFTRNKELNIMSKTQSLKTLLNCGIPLLDALILLGIGDDPIIISQHSQEYAIQKRSDDLKYQEDLLNLTKDNNTKNNVKEGE